MKLVAILLCCLVGLQAAGASSKQNSDTPAKPTVSTSSNPLLPNALFTPWDKVKPEHVEPAVKQVLEEEGAALDLLEADLEAAGKDVTYQRLFRPYAQIRYRLDATYGRMDNLQSVADTPALRKAVEATQAERIAFELRFSQSKPIYNAVMAVCNSPAFDKLNPVQQRIVNLTVKDFQTSGVGLEPEKRKQYNAIIDRLAKLNTNFSNNVLDSTAEFKYLVKDKKELEGLEATTLAVAAQKAAEAGHKGATAESGPWLLTLDYTTYSSVVSFAKNRELRKKVYTAYRRIAADGKTDNTGIIKEILQNRLEMSELLGFKTYADQAFLSKMATFKQANALMDELTAVARPVSIKEDNALQAFARNATGDRSFKLEWWDNAYWAERQKEAKFRVKQEELRQYLPLPSVKAGMFQLAKRLYGITVKKSTQKLPVWHPDVEVYEVFDGNSTTPLAYFYSDLYARPGSKQNGAWVQTMADRANWHMEASPAARAAAEIKAKGGDVKKQLYTAKLAQEQAKWLAGAQLQLPLAVLVSNQNPPAGGKPSLMTLDDAETLFHEFGHALQAMLTTVEEPLAAGMRNIEWDAVEAPSQMQEKWVYDRNTLNSFAKHWETGKPLPEDLFQRIKAMRTYRKGNYFTYQLMLATTDLILHSTFDPRGNMAASQIQQQQYAKIMPFAPYPGDRQINSFTHVFGGGYPAAYYSYLWSDVMSADGFMAFVEAGTTNEAEVRRLGQLFRDTFFAQGGGLPPAEVFRRFRGRDPIVAEVIKFNELGTTK